MNINQSTIHPTLRNQRRVHWRRRPSHQPRGFLLLTVLLVVSILALASLNFSDSMLTAHEAARIDSQRFQARMMVESGVQIARYYAAQPPLMREEMGGAWDNPQKFQAINIVANIDPARRGNVSFIAPSLDQAGMVNGYRFGMQNESAKLNLNALVQLDKISQTLSSASSALSGLAGGAAGGSAGAGTTSSTSGTSGSNGGPAPLTGPGGPNSRGGAAAFGSAPTSQSSAGAASSLASSATSTSQGIGSQMLLGIPGMTEDVADAILDFLDEDEDTRPYGCEFADYYQQLQPAYKPLNGPLTSIEQLLLVRGVTPQLLYGYDQNRNGVLDASEQNQMAMGVQVGGMPGAAPMANSTAATASDGTQLVQASALGWASFLTLHSQERNVAADGTKRVNINGDDLQQLKADLEAAGVNELFSSYIIGYRLGGQPPPGAGSPLQTLMTAAAANSSQSGMAGQQLSQLSGLAQAAGGPAGGQGGGQAGQGQQQKKAWTSSALSDVDLTTAQGSVKFNQVLDLIGSSVTIGRQAGQGGQATTGAQAGQGQAAAGGQPGGGQSYNSPIEDSPLALADAMPILMDKLTTVDAEALPGRINIMECPREILAGIPGLTDEVVEKILEARVDGAQTENRKFETWLVVEGIVTTDQMRGFLPLMTCGGDVFKAQIIGYFEGSSAFARVEAIISGIDATPKLLFVRRLDHLGRGFDVMTLGQRMDIGITPSAVKR